MFKYPEHLYCILLSMMTLNSNDTSHLQQEIVKKSEMKNDSKTDCWRMQEKEIP
jgi:hypothetical protein